MARVVSSTVQFLSTAALNVTSPPDADFDNHTGNATTTQAPVGSPYSTWQVALIVVACGILVVGTVIGNVLVVTAVAVVRRLRTPSNLLIVSLAISDLLVAVLDMPFATLHEVNQPHDSYWPSFRAHTHPIIIYSVSQKSSPVKLFVVFYLLVDLCN